ncbi:unnamed protein product [Aspergillus oryzae]|nr:unnamed protein product [Aspergillus oryzae]
MSRRSSSRAESSPATVYTAENLVKDMVCLSPPYKALSVARILTLVFPGTLTTIQNGKPVKEVAPTVEPPTWSEYYRKLARALAGEGDLPASGAEARDVIRLIELAQESSRQGKTLDV